MNYYFFSLIQRVSARNLGSGTPTEFGFTFRFACHLDEFPERKPVTVKAAKLFVFCDVAVSVCLLEECVWCKDLTLMA